MIKGATVECMPNDCPRKIHKVTPALMCDLAALNGMGMLWQKMAQHDPLFTIERRIDLCVICIVGQNELDQAMGQL